MAEHILTADEAARTLRTLATDPIMLDLLPAVDKYIRNATDHDWTADTTVSETAKSAARMLLTMYYENPAMIGSEHVLSFGLHAVLTQLEAEAFTISEAAEELAENESAEETADETAEEAEWAERQEELERLRHEAS
jgi:hypothetical protein